jgi:hypothetical protein
LRLRAWLALLLATSPALAEDIKPSERLQRAVDAPFRWILLHSAAPRPRPTEPVADKPRPRAATPSKAAAVPVPLPPAMLADRVAPPSPPPAPLAETVLDVIDMALARTQPSGVIEDPSGGYVQPLLRRYSTVSPNPVTASMQHEPERGLLRVDYTVPASVGAAGGTNVWLNLAGEGVDLRQLLPGGAGVERPDGQAQPGDGLLEIELDVSAPTRLKVFIVGPTESPGGAYPYFILPVEPGLRRYGLLLSDFLQPAWASNAPDITLALSSALAVGVEYSRGDAGGLADQGSFWVGGVRFSRWR